MLKKTLTKLILWPVVFIHNSAYHIISQCALILNSGLHPKHRLTRYHQFFLHNIQRGDRILDLGCGNGFLAFALAQKAKFVLAIDLNKKNIALARKKYSAPNIEYKVGDVTQISIKQRFDAVILSNILEHIKERIVFLNKIKKMAPKILIRVPLASRDWLTLYKKELGCEWRLDKTHYTEYTLKSFQKELTLAGLKIKKYYLQFGEIWAVAS